MNAMNKEQLLGILSDNAVSIYMEHICEYTVTVSHFPTSEKRQLQFLKKKWGAGEEEVYCHLFATVCAASHENFQVVRWRWPIFDLQITNI